jgi:hypothetical protein
MHSSRNLVHLRGAYVKAAEDCRAPRRFALNDVDFITRL